MKTLIIVILFLLCTQVLSQIDNRDKVNHIDILIERINSDSVFFGELRYLLEADNFQNIDSKKIINKTALDNGSQTVEFFLQMWNGTNWCNAVKETYKYNENHKLVEYLWQGWKNSNWVNDCRQICKYDENNNRIESIFQKWDGSKWVNDQRYTFSYDGSNHLVEWTQQKWDISKWVDYYKRIYTYDENNNLITYLEQRSRGSNWFNIKKYLYTFDENNNRIKILLLRWVNSCWINNLKYKYSYDESSNLIEKLIHNWVDSSWINDQKWTYTSEGENNLQELWEIWNGSEWRKYEFYECIYDDDGNIIECFQKRCSYSIWKNWSKKIYTYDGNNKLQELKLRWDGTNWKNYRKFSSVYDEYNCLTSALCQQWNGIEWDNYMRKTYTNTYCNLISSVEEDNNITYKLSQNYPNPFNPSTKIIYSIPKLSYVSIKVFDVLGREVSTVVSKEQAIGNYEVEFDASNLTSGIYFYRIQAGKFVETKKMILLQ